MDKPDQPVSVTAEPPDSGAGAPGQAPARRRRTGLMVGVAIVVVVLVASGVAAEKLLRPGVIATSLPAATSAPAGTSQPPPTVVATATRYAGTLQALAISMPAGATREPLRMGAKDGTLDLGGVLDEYDGDARESARDLLTSLEFERGLFLAWTDGKGVLVYVQIYQFHYEHQAAAWSAAEARGLNDVAESTAVFDEILGGRWFVTTTPSGRGAVHARYSKGDLAVMLSIFTKGKADVDYLKRLSVDQYRKLP